MARREVRHVAGIHVPQLERGLRAHAARFADRVRLPVVDALDRREPFLIGGDLAWSGLYQADPAAADAFARRCGWQSGAAAAWKTTDRTVWTYDPRTAVLQPAEPPNGDT